MQAGDTAIYVGERGRQKVRILHAGMDHGWYKIRFKNGRFAIVPFNVLVPKQNLFAAMKFWWRTRKLAKAL